MLAGYLDGVDYCCTLLYESKIYIVRTTTENLDHQQHVRRLISIKQSPLVCEHSSHEIKFWSLHRFNIDREYPTTLSQLATTLTSSYTYVSHGKVLYT